MLTREDNELITRVGPGTPMGETMRRYWMPALLARELPSPDCTPVLVGLLGEQLIAFRDSTGRVGLLGQHCPHRGASLFFGRNEECGLRCVYHGWKYDVDGNCVDMPNEPPESNFKDKIRHTAYPCEERGGVIWTYMGAPETRPPLPNLEWMRLPEGHSFVSKTYEACNYLQGIEGGIDTSHSSFLHRRPVDGKAYAHTEILRQRSTAPKLEVLNTDYGFTYAGIRNLPDEDQNYVRVYHFVMPFQQVRAFEGYTHERPTVQGHMWAPIDDEHTFIYNWIYLRDGSKMTEDDILTEEREAGRGPEDLLPNYHLKANAANDYLIDRQAQRDGSYTGIPGINPQDVAIQESMGPIYDRTAEHLGTTDVAIIAARRLLIQAARDVQAGRDPLGANGGSSDKIRPGERVMPASTPWHEGIADLLVAVS